MSDESHDHGHHDDHQHHRDSNQSRTFAVLVVSTSRTGADDESGPTARAAIEAAGHEVPTQQVVADDRDAIAETVDALVGEVDVVVTSGGTGLTPDDVTVEAIRPLLDKELPGVGEYFRRLSHEQVGTVAMLSRATAGVADGTAVYAFPGNPDAVELGVEAVLLPQIEHVLELSRR
jgi:molybdenum cofactor biosynthesis protein B